MRRTSIIIACVLTLSAPVVMAQSSTTVQPQPDRQQAMAPVISDQTGRTFVYDEFGNVYDSRGELITPRPVKLKH